MALSLTHNDSTVTVGDTVRVHQEISEGDKSRVQIFEGIIIAIKNSGAGKSFTVRRMGANGIGVERIYPLQMPGLKKVEIKTKGHVKRAKLYYLRERVGKAATRIREKKASVAVAKAS